MVMDDGSGVEQPFLVNGPDMAIFDAGDHWSLRVAGQGERQSIPKDASEHFWAELRDAGWHEPDLAAGDDDE
jgi:hypothetical protein